MMKAWATSADTGPMQHASVEQGVQQHATTVNYQLAQVATKLEQALPSDAPVVQAEPAAASSTDRGQHVSDLQCLQKSLEAMPLSPDFREDRERLLQRIAEKTYAITMSNPIGTRFETAKVALERAKSRLQTSEEAFKLAQDAKGQAEQ